MINMELKLRMAESLQTDRYNLFQLIVESYHASLDWLKSLKSLKSLIRSHGQIQALALRSDAGNAQKCALHPPLSYMRR